MSDPIASKYEQTAWQPTVDTKAKGAKDQEKAAAKYDTIYGGTYATGKSDDSSDAGPTKPVPNVAMSYSVAPDFIPTSEQPSASGGGDDSMPGGEFSVDLGAMRTCETACLTATSATIDGYNTLKSLVTGAIGSGTLFGQDVGTVSPPPPTKAGWYGGDTSPKVTHDKLDDEGKKFAAAIDPAMQNLLNGVGGIIELMGVFNAVLNNAGQMYTQADYNSKFTI